MLSISDNSLFTIKLAADTSIGGSMSSAIRQREKLFQLAIQLGDGHISHDQLLGLVPAEMQDSVRLLSRSTASTTHCARLVLACAIFDSPDTAVNHLAKRFEHVHAPLTEAAVKKLVVGMEAGLKKARRQETDTGREFFVIRGIRV